MTTRIRLIVILAMLANLVVSTAPGRAQDPSPMPAWRDIQRLLKQNGFTGVTENGDRSDWASNRALILFCRNIDCAKHEKTNPTAAQELDSWSQALEDGRLRRTAGSYAGIESTNVRPVPTPAYFIDSGAKIVSFDGDDFSIWQTNDFRRLSYHRLGLDGEPPSYWEYALTLSADKGLSAAVNKYWITIVDNRSGLVVGWLPLTLLEGQTFKNIKDYDRPEARFLADATKLLVARNDGLVSVFDWTTGKTTTLRGPLPKNVRSKPSIASTPAATKLVVSLERSSELLVVSTSSSQIKASRATAPANRWIEFQGMNETQALFKADSKPHTGFLLDLTTGRTQPFKTDSLCRHAATIGLGQSTHVRRTAGSDNGSLSLTERRFDCEPTTLMAASETTLCKTIACQDYTDMVDIDSSTNNILVALRTGFGLLRRRDDAKGNARWIASLPPTLGPHGLSSDANNAPVTFSERGQIFSAEASSGTARLKANLDSVSVVSIANAPNPSDWIALSKTGELTVARADGTIRRLALSSDRSPDNAQLFVANNNRTAVVVLPTSKNPTSRDWGGSDVAIVDIETLTIRRTFRVNPLQAPKETPQIWVLSQTTATMLNDGRHLAIAIFEPSIQVFDIQTGARVKVISTAFRNVKWGSAELASSRFVASLRTASELDQRLYLSPAKLSARGHQALTITLGITGFIDTRMIATTNNAFSDPVTVLSVLKSFQQVLETANPEEHLVLFSNGILAKIDLTGTFKTVYAREGISRVARLGKDGLLYAITPGGIVKIFGEKAGDLKAELAIYEDGEWLIQTPEGFFDASKGGRTRVAVRSGPMQVIAIDSFYDALFRPDLVREKLAGDTTGLVREAAARLDLTRIVNSGLPPEAVIVAPVPGSLAPSDRVRAEALVTDRGGGIGRVEWKVNGVTQGEIAQRGLVRIEDESGGRAKVSQLLTLDSGQNVIELTVYNGANLVSSAGTSVLVSLPENAAKTPPMLYVLAVGINDYLDGRMRLRYAVPDAIEVAKAFARAGTDLYETVEVEALTDGQVTVDGLERAFSGLSKRIRPQDILVFYAAGHGKTVDGRYYYLPRDFRYQTEASIPERGIGQDKWQSWLARISARKSIIIFDTCESGSLTGSDMQQVAMRSGLELQAALGRLIRATGRTVLTAATSDRPAIEGYKGHGVFTYALLDGFARADRNGNGLIEVTELAGFVDEAVPEITERMFGLRQFPQMSLQGSDFSLVRKSNALGPSSPGLPSAPRDGAPSKPTHVVIEAVTVRIDAHKKSTFVLELAPATLIAVVKTENGWSLLARDGRILGYVEEDKAKRLQ